MSQDQLKSLKRMPSFKKLFVDFIQKRLITNGDKLNVIIFGASGFTGRNTVLHAVNVLKDCNWAIAGRNQHKLKAILKDVGRKTNTNINKIPIIVANVSDKVSLTQMTDKCQVLVNCCGPYLLYGEAVINACIATGTHYVDMSCEPNYLELMQLKYHKPAKSHNVYIVLACGLHSLPVEVGMNFLREKFDGTINSVESYTEYWTTDFNVIPPFPAVAGSGVWSSFIMHCANIKDLPAIRNMLQKREYSQMKPKTYYKPLLHTSDIVRGICLPFPLFDQQVVECSQHHFHEKEQKRPIQFHSYLTFSSYIMAACFFFFLLFIIILAQFKCTRGILLKYPKIFTLGFISHDGPTEKQMDNIFYRQTLNAVGWSMPISIRNENYLEHIEPRKQLKLKMHGSNPIYGLGSICLLASANTILNENEKMPESGGVYTPGAAFQYTDIKTELEKSESGLVFEIV